MMTSSVFSVDLDLVWELERSNCGLLMSNSLRASPAAWLRCRVAIFFLPSEQTAKPNFYGLASTVCVKTSVVIKSLVMYSSLQIGPDRIPQPNISAKKKLDMVATHYKIP